jgi:bifunctional non-homologous end joining protein LigD
MLASRGMPPVDDLDGWAVEPKLDGWRVLVSVDGGDLMVRSRTGRAITTSLPELAPLAELGARLVLDGELIVGAGKMADFYGLSGRLAGRGGSRSLPVMFIAFDLVWNDGHDLTGHTWVERRRQLEALDLPGDLVGVVPSYPGPDAPLLLQACEEHGLEGVVVKRSLSTYRQGERSNDWRKVKCATWTQHAERRRLSRR